MDFTRLWAGVPDQLSKLAAVLLVSHHMPRITVCTAGAGPAGVRGHVARGVMGLACTARAGAAILERAWANWMMPLVQSAEAGGRRGFDGGALVQGWTWKEESRKRRRTSF